MQIPKEWTFANMMWPKVLNIMCANNYRGTIF